MTTENILLIFLGTTYFTELLFLSILLGTNFFSKEVQEITPFRRYCTFAFTIDAVALLTSALFFFDSDISNFENGIINSLDGFVLWALLVAGIQLISDLKNPKRLGLILGLPYLIVLVFHICTGGEMIIVGQTIILIAGIVEAIYLMHCFLLHDRRLKNQKSNIENLTSSWFGIFCIAVFSELIIWFLVHINPESFSWLRSLYLGFIQVCYAFLAHFAIKQGKTTLQALEEPSSAVSSSQKSENIIQTPSVLVKMLEDCMENDKLYLDPDLTIEKLADSLSTNSNYIYKCIHDIMGSTFYDFINGHRIEESKRLLLQGEFKIEEIALNSGFNSSRSFQRAFKRVTDTTPSEWRKAQK